MAAEPEPVVVRKLPLPEALRYAGLPVVPEDVCAALLRTVPVLRPDEAAERDVPADADEDRTALDVEDALRVTPEAELRDVRTVPVAPPRETADDRVVEAVLPVELLRVTEAAVLPRLTLPVLPERPPMPSVPRRRVVALVP